MIKCFEIVIRYMALNNLVVFVIFYCGLCQVKLVLPILRQLIDLDDEEVLTNACWTLSYLSDGPKDQVQAVIEAGVCQRLQELLL